MDRPQFTPQQRAFVVSEYHRNNNSLNRVLQRFREEYPNTCCPCRATVHKNVRKYSVSGTSGNLNKGHSGHGRTARSEAVRNAIEEANEEGIPDEMRITCR